MSIEALFDNTCDIYHVSKNSQPTGYGLPNKNTYQYSATPDLQDIPCHFKQVVDGTGVSIAYPNTQMSGDFILKLPIGTDVRVNDKIVDKESKLTYTCHVPPRAVRNNHLKVKLHLEQNI